MVVFSLDSNYNVLNESHNHSRQSNSANCKQFKFLCASLFLLNGH